MEECFQAADKVLVGTLISTLTTMKYDSSHIMNEHVLEILLQQQS